MFRIYKFSIQTVFLLFILWGCQQDHEYHRRMKEELASGIRYDSLFLGLSLGMVQRDFYGHCWELNKKGLIRQGSGNTTVLYEMKELKEPADMNFYPSFYESKIWEMPVKFNYVAWAPWNKQLSSDSLLIDVLQLFKKEYGSDFMEIKHRKWGSAYVWLHGNRRISLFKIDEQFVMAIFTDMLVEQLLDDKEKENNVGMPGG